MKRPEFRNLVREDFPDQDWIEKLIRPLNQVLGQVAAGLGNGLTLGENLNAEVRTLDFTTQDEWIPLALANSWAIYDSVPEQPAYRHEGGRVFLRGSVKGGTANTVAATLPAPSRSVYLPPAWAQFGGTLAPARANVDTTGALVLGVSSAGVADWFGLSGLSYAPAEPRPANACFPVKFKTKVSGKLSGIIVVRCVEIAGRDERNVAEAIGAPGWAQDGQTVSLLGVGGLTGGRSYRLTLALFGG